MQFRIPRAYGPRLKAAAEGVGISATAWVRQLIIRQLDRDNTTVQAWTLPAGVAKRHAPVREIQTHPPDLFLSPVEQTAPTERTFRPLQRIEGTMKPWSMGALRAHDVAWFTNPQGYRFVLAGGSVWGLVVALEMDRGDGPALEMTLELERA